MSDKTEATISGFNEYKNTLRREADGNVVLTLTQFDTRVNRIHSGVEISDVPDLNRGSYVPGGMTALYDAVGQAIRDTEKAARKSDRVLVVIMTDGYENSSREWQHQGILKLLESKRAAEWEFVFLGAGEEAWAAGHSLGFASADSISYDASPRSARKAYSALASTTADYSRGINTVQSLSTNSIKKELEDEAGSANITLTPNTPGLFTSTSRTAAVTPVVTFVPVDPDPQEDEKTSK